MRLLSSGTFLLRHLVAVPVITLTLCSAWICLYFVLLLIAMFSNAGLGGPLALPAGIIFIGVVSVALGWGVFAPACALGAAFCGIFRLPKLAAIPVVWLATCILGCLVYLLFDKLTSTASMPSVGNVLLNCAIYLSIPIGLYWWLIEGPSALLNLATKSWLRFKR